MKLNRAATTVAGVAVAGVAVISGCGVTHPPAATAAHSASAKPSQAHQVSDGAMVRSATKRPAESAHHASPQPASASPSSSADPALVWLESAGGQAQVTFNDDVDSVAGALEIESQSTTVANHLVFEADARVMRAEAQKILADPALLPAVNRAAYEGMLDDFIVVANLLQPGPGYGTTAQDWSAWDVAMRASNINVS